MRALDQLALELHNLAVENSKLSLGTSTSGVHLDGKILGESGGGREEGESLIEDVEDGSEVVRAAKKKRDSARRRGAAGEHADSQVFHDRGSSGGDREVGVLEDVLLREAPMAASQEKRKSAAVPTS